jgi:hypothetical protein
MKKTLPSILVGLILLSCEQRNILDNVAESGTQPTNVFKVAKVDEEDFTVVERNDTTYYLKQLHEGLDGKKIQFDQSQVSDLSAKIRFDFGFLQYTIDDNTALPLGYTKQSKWADLKVKVGVIEIPDFNGNSTNTTVYETFGFKNTEQLLEWIAGNELEEIKKKSIQAQTNYYQTLLQDKNQYESSCPEYIQQANAFLNSHSQDKKSIAELGVELTYNSMTIDVEGQLKSGQKFHQVIVEK